LRLTEGTRGGGTEKEDGRRVRKKSRGIDKKKSLERSPYWTCAAFEGEKTKRHHRSRKKKPSKKKQRKKNEKSSWGERVVPSSST